MERLFRIWQGAVEATHHFLAPEDFADIERLVENDYLPAAQLWVAVGDDDRPLGFMGLSGSNIDALFVDPERHGQGIGRALVAHAQAIARSGLTVDVNEQNESGAGFYERLGFRRAGRSELDDQGRPYPLLHMALSVAREG